MYFSPCVLYISASRSEEVDVARAGSGTELAGSGTELAGSGTELAGSGTELRKVENISQYKVENISFFYNLFTKGTDKNTLQIRGSKRGAKRSTWLFGS
jgi:hypothetical protein